MGIIRESFVIFKNWTDAINALPDEYQLETYKALVAYGVNGEIPENLSPVAHAMLISFSVGMQNSICRYSASVENGKLGGRPSKKGSTKNPEKREQTQENQGKPSHILEEPKQTQVNLNEPTRNLNVNDNVNVNIKKKNKKEKTCTALVGSESVQKEIMTDAEVIEYIKSNIEDERIQQKFIDFANNRKAMGKKYAIRTKTTLDVNIRNLKKWSKSIDEALAILDYSIANNYQGLFEPKTNFKEKREKVTSEEALVWE